MGSGVFVNVISARSVARLTTASCICGTAFKAHSTRPTHDAHVIPSTGKLSRLAEDNVVLVFIKNPLLNMV